MSSSQLTDHRLDARENLHRVGFDPMGAVGQRAQPTLAIPAHPGMHRLPRHPVPASHVGDLRPDNTSITA